jgi:hypothetical protein
MWDFNKTELRLYFGELPDKKELIIQLTHWVEDLSKIPTERDTKPIWLRGKFLIDLRTESGKEITANTEVIIGFWKTIYDKWRSAPKSRVLDSNLPVNLHIKRTGERKWHILKIDQGKAQ